MLIALITGLLSLSLSLEEKSYEYLRIVYFLEPSFVSLSLSYIVQVPRTRSFRNFYSLSIMSRSRFTYRFWKFVVKSLRAKCNELQFKDREREI